MDRLKSFLNHGDGNGDGYGSGYGDGCGYGSGDGSGYGYGNGNGNGDGYGNGDGNGQGNGNGHGNGQGNGNGNGDGDIPRLNGEDVYHVDGIPTVLRSVVGNIAKGAIVKQDLSLFPCFVARAGDYWAHGTTAREALRDAQAKRNEDAPEEDRIEAFWEKFSRTDRYTGHQLLDAHRALTLSCEMGCAAFVKSKEIDLDATFTVDEFIDITKDAYEPDLMRQLKEWK